VAVGAHQWDAMRALSIGLAVHDIEARIETAAAAPLADDDFFISWCDKTPGRAIGAAHLILECGYINGSSGNYTDDRLRFISTAWNQRHGLSDWYWPEHVSGERSDALASIWCRGNQAASMCCYWSRRRAIVRRRWCDISAARFNGIVRVVIHRAACAITRRMKATNAVSPPT